MGNEVTGRVHRCQTSGFMSVGWYFFWPIGQRMQCTGSHNDVNDCVLGGGVLG